MRYSTIAVIIMMMGITLMSCNNDKTESTIADKKTAMENSTSTNAERNKQNVVKIIDAFNQHKFDEFKSYSTTDVVDHEPGVNGKTIKGIDSVMAGLQMYITAFPDMKVTTTQLVAEGDWVAVFSNWKGTWTGEIMGMKPTGKSFNVNDADLYKFNGDGKLIEHWPTQEIGAIAQQVGMTMPK